MISIRKAKGALSGLDDLCSWINGQGYNTKNMTLVQIGVYVGDSTKIFKKYFKKIYDVDPFLNGYDDNDASSYKYSMSQIEKQYDETIENFKNVEKLKGYSIDISKTFEDKSIDIVYIDGLHTYEGVKSDIISWFNKIKDNGIIAGHDWQASFQGVENAVKEMLGDPEKRFSDTSWIIRKENTKIFKGET